MGGMLFGVLGAVGGKAAKPTYFVAQAELQLDFRSELEPNKAWPSARLELEKKAMQAKPGQRVSRSAIYFPRSRAKQNTARRGTELDAILLPQGV